MKIYKNYFKHGDVPKHAKYEDTISVGAHQAPGLLAAGVSDLLTLSFAPFGYYGCVTHADIREIFFKGK